MTIRVLPQIVTSQIAAGEVVERPASVVKELVENALDAKARQISVDIRLGGMESIRVVDDGQGMSPEDAMLSLQRYATSKLLTVDDLDHINTLGFRGEALPSITAVSDFCLQTRIYESDHGWEVKGRDGTISGEGPQGCPRGTTITISNLFQNLPVRRKFLRSNISEGRRVTQQISNFILAYPEVRFNLLIDGKSTIQSAGNGSYADALGVVLGVNTAGQMLPVDDEFGGNYRVTGFIGPPSIHRTNRRHITFFVNRRWSSSRLMSVAVEGSYTGLLPQGRHPIAILNITVPSNELDVNVHPMKHEVRFLNENLVFDAIQRSVRNTILSESPVPPLIPRVYEGDHQAIAGVDSGTPLGFLDGFGAEGQSITDSHDGSVSRSRDVFPRLRVLGQVANTYVVAEGPDGVFFLDQHAAHERVLYERVLENKSKNLCNEQILLEPVVVEMAAQEWEILGTALSKELTLGFSLEPFGGNSYLLRSVPAVFKDLDPIVGLREVLDMMGKETRIKSRLEILAASVACHSSVRAGLRLTHSEMIEIINLLGKTENPHTCPHGRPTVRRLSTRYLERQFGRS
mgnify:CR=1 FL=1